MQIARELLRTLLTVNGSVHPTRPARAVAGQRRRRRWRRRRRRLAAAAVVGARVHTGVCVGVSRGAREDAAAAVDESTPSLFHERRREQEREQERRQAWNREARTIWIAWSGLEQPSRSETADLDPAASPPCAWSSRALTCEIREYLIIDMIANSSRRDPHDAASPTRIP